MLNFLFSIFAMASALVPQVETAQSPYVGDSVDDAAIWQHPTNPELSVIVTTLKASNQRPVKPTGILTYDLNGRQLEFFQGGTPNNVDIRHNFDFDDGPGQLIAVSHWYSDKVLLYKIDPMTRRVVELGSIQTTVDKLRGLCMAKTETGFHFFAAGSSGMIEQYRITSPATAELVQQWQLESETEGCVVDDDTSTLYVAEENKGIWSIPFSADSAEPEAFAMTSWFGPLSSGLEGLALIKVDGSQHLVVSVQEKSRFAIYDISNQEHLGNFYIAANDRIDAVSKTDGIHISGIQTEAFPDGIIVVHDDLNRSATGQAENQNFKLVSRAALLNLIKKLRAEVN